MNSRAWLLRSAGLGGVALLGACGGGGGGGVASTPPPVAVVTPTPVTTPAPAPPPAASTPTTTTGNDTAEYRATVGAVSMNALAAYNAAATGRGIGLAVIDSGIDLQSAEFDARLSPASRAFGGGTTVDDEGGHGTAVAFTAAGRRNGTGTHGVAFEATVIALRVDRPGTCASGAVDDSDSGCRFGTDAIAAAVDGARVAGARVINMSLGGSVMPEDLQAAIGRATAAGIVVVIAAGNDGTDSPDPFTQIAGTPTARGSVIVAGSVGSGGALSTFSDKAGSGAATYLTAVGERVRAPDQNGTAYIWSGTSFAAPQISGAVALLAQAFPNLSGAQIVDLLLTTARDAGAPGTDAIYGRGILDLTRAFQPVGATAVAGRAAATLSAGAGQLSAPMGDARALGLGAVILDGYDRAFATDLASTITRMPSARPLTGALMSTPRQLAMQAGGTAVAMTLAPIRGVAEHSARAVAGTVTQRLGERTSLGFAFGLGGGALTAQLVGQREPGFLLTDPASLGIDTAARSAGAMRHRLGAWGLTAAAESGDVLTGYRRLGGWQRSGYDRVALTLDRQVGPIATVMSATRLTERDTLLGARLGPSLGAPGSTSWFVDAAARLDAGAGWTLGARLRQGWTAATVHGLTGGGTLRTDAFSADIGKAGIFGRDSLGLRIAQPLRVAGGGLELTLPTAWDYASATVGTWTTQRLALAPTGRELDVEARYLIPAAGGALQTNLFWRRDPGNIAGLPADVGAALRWSRGF